MAADAEAAPQARPTWRFPASFWTANAIELFERAAYYGVFISLTLYLTKVVGFNDVTANIVGGVFSGMIYALPFGTGVVADRIGFRPALAIAFTLLTIGYLGLGVYPQPHLVLISLGLIATGGSFVKAIIPGTVAKSSDQTNRARAYSIFYMMVNVGAFLGKTVAKPVRVELGQRYVPLYSAGAALIALVLILVAYWPKGALATSDKARPGLRAMLRCARNLRFTSLVLITAGFWAIQGQMYAAMPQYVTRTVGEGASPEWYANVNPLVVVLFATPITQLVKRYSPIASMTIALAMIPFSALIMASARMLSSDMHLGGLVLHPVTVTMLLGIALQGLAECFLSPRYLEYASQQAPPGEEGLYLGYAHLNTFVAWPLGFIISGFLLDAYCPDPRKLSAAVQAQHTLAMAGKAAMPEVYQHAYYLWYVWAAIGVLAFIALLAFHAVTRRQGGHAAREGAGAKSS